MLFLQSLLFLSIFLLPIIVYSVEELSISGPMELHDIALNEFVQMRRSDPTVSFSEGPLLETIREHSVKRLMTVSNELLTLIVSHNNELFVSVLFTFISAMYILFVFVLLV